MHCANHCYGSKPCLCPDENIDNEKQNTELEACQLQNQEAEQIQKDLQKDREAVATLLTEQVEENEQKENTELEACQLKEQEAEQLHKDREAAATLLTEQVEENEQKENTEPEACQLKEQEAEQLHKDREAAAALLTEQVEENEQKENTELEACQLKEQEAEQLQKDREAAAALLPEQVEENEQKENTELEECQLQEQEGEQLQKGMQKNREAAATLLTEQVEEKSRDNELTEDLENINVVVDLTDNGNPLPVVADIQQTIASTEVNGSTDHDSDTKWIGKEGKEDILFKVGGKQYFPKSLVTVYLHLRTSEENFTFGQCFDDEKKRYAIMGFTVQEDYNAELQTVESSTVAHLHVKSGARSFSDLVVSVDYLRALKSKQEYMMRKISDYEEYKPLFTAKVMC